MHTVGINEKLTKAWFGSVVVQCWYRQGSVYVLCIDTHLALYMYCLLRPTTTELPQYLSGYSTGLEKQCCGFESHLGQLAYCLKRRESDHLSWCTCSCVALLCLMSV